MWLVIIGFIILEICVLTQPNVSVSAGDIITLIIANLYIIAAHTWFSILQVVGAILISGIFGYTWWGFLIALIVLFFATIGIKLLIANKRGK